MSSRQPRQSLRMRYSALPDAFKTRVRLIHAPTPLEPLPNLSAQVGGPQLFVKRDDAIPAGFGGNKLRKLEFVVHRAEAEGAGTLLTMGGVQSNHARATAAAAALRGLQCHLVLNGGPMARPTGNLRLMGLYGASIEFVGDRDHREPALAAAVRRLRDDGQRPYAVPLGASTALGARGFVRAVCELVSQMTPPDVILHATSSGGTQAGLIAGCRLMGLPTRVIGISADEPARVVRDVVARLLDELRAECGPAMTAAATDIEVDDSFVGFGYGMSTAASTEAQLLAARSEGLLLDPTYTAKAMAALVAYCRGGRFGPSDRVVFWHTGGLPGLFV